MTGLEALKDQLAQLDELIRGGVLTGDAARQARDRLEADILAKVLQPAAPAQAPAAEEVTKPSARLWLGLVSFVLVFGAAGYAWLGNPAALAVAPGMAAAPSAEDSQAAALAQFEAMTERLVERLKNQPDDAEGWAMLGRSYSVLQRFPQAVQAYQRAITLRPNDAQAHADQADALAMVNGQKLDGEPEKLVNRALQLDPDNPKALSLAGTIALDRGDAALAAQHWERALRKVEPGSEIASRLQGGIDEARQRAGLPALAIATATVPAASNATAATGASVQLRVTLAPGGGAKAAPEDTLFIFARAVQGPRAPLAIQRRQVKDLPLDITLDDSMAMSPALRLSSVAQVVVGARISKSGNAMPQPGDLQGLTSTVAVGAQGVALQISEVLP